LSDGSIKTLVTEEANIEELLPLPRINSIIFHSTFRGISSANIFDLSTNTHKTLSKLDDGSIKIHSTKDSEKLLLGIQYRFSQRPQLVEIDAQSNKISSLYDEILTQEQTIPPSKVIELNTEDSFRAFLWESKELNRTKNGIIFVHGGPATFIGPEWSREYANYVKHGWTIFVPNYHGSSSEGERFLKNNALAIQVEDIVSSIKYMRDYLPKNGKLLIAGQSYGSRLVIESLREVGELIDGVILTSTIYGSPHEIPCDKRPSYVRAFHGGEDYLNSADGITSYLQQILGKNNFNINVMPEEGHILRKESSFKNIRNAILKSDMATTYKCP
jgi:pimeloyl-ACP methyl ester carboxylesterase